MKRLMKNGKIRKNLLKNEKIYKKCKKNMENIEIYKN